MSIMDLTGVPALTLLNPWAELIAHHGKNVENRSWMPHEGVHRFLVHSGKRWTDGGLELLREYESTWMPDTSAIVAVADLAFVCNTSRWKDTVVCGCGPWAMPGQCHWNLTNVRALPEPVAAVGKQGLWQPTPEVRRAVAAQLAPVRVGDGGEG